MPEALDTLDIEAMEECELLTLLARLYGEFLERLADYHDVGEGDPAGDKTGTVSGPVPDALAAGIVLADRLETLSRVFIDGPSGDDHGIQGCEGVGDDWLVGVRKFHRELSGEAASPLAVLS